MTQTVTAASPLLAVPLSQDVLTETVNKVSSSCGGLASYPGLPRVEGLGTRLVVG